MLSNFPSINNILMRLSVQVTPVLGGFVINLCRWTINPQLRCTLNGQCSCTITPAQLQLLASPSFSFVCFADGTSVSRTGDSDVGIFSSAEFIHNILLSGETIEDATLDLGGIYNHQTCFFRCTNSFSKPPATSEVLPINLIATRPSCRMCPTIAEIDRQSSARSHVAKSLGTGLINGGWESQSRLCK